MPTAATADAPQEPRRLKRALGPVQIAIYGLGSMLGAGIYGLIGVAAGQMGSAVWLAFGVAMVAALLTGLTYASVGSRYPRAAGAAYVTQRAFRTPLLSYTVGLAVTASGLTSAATQARVVANNLQRIEWLAAIPEVLLALGFILILAGIVIRGIKESAWLNFVCTAVEALGLLIVIAVGVSFWGSTDLTQTPEGPLAFDYATASLAMQGAVLTFFSFIGFEDILNMGEEVKDPHTTMPIGIIAAMIMAAVIYMAVAITAVSVVPWQELKDAKGPLVEVVARAAPWFPPAVFVVITIFAVTNTALVNFVTSSRLAYGMANHGLLPSWLGRVHRTRHTPHVAVLVLLAIIATLVVIGNVAQLASATVLLLLLAFTVVNAGLLVLKRRPDEPKGRFEVPAIVPLLGAVICAALMLVRGITGDWQAPALAAALIVAIVVMYQVMHPKSPVLEDDG